MALLKATCLFELTVELMVNNTSCGLVCDYIWFLPWLYFLLYKLPFGLLLQIHCTVWVFKALFVKPCDFSTCLVQSSHWFKREEEFVLMAVVQSWSIQTQISVSEVSCNTYTTVYENQGWKRRNGAEIRGKVPLMILNQTKPFPVPRASPVQHFPYMVMVFAWMESPWP